MAKPTPQEPTPGSIWCPVPVPGYEHLYEVSDHGQVRRTGPSKNKTVGHILTLIVDRKGYRYACLTDRGRQRQRLVHRLVAIAFLGSPPPEYEVNHKDGDKANNHVRNLEWVTGEQNREHAVRTGLTPLGERNGQAKLTRQQADEIRALKGKEYGWFLAERYGVSDSTIYLIWAGETWR